MDIMLREYKVRFLGSYSKVHFSLHLQFSLKKALIIALLQRYEKEHLENGNHRNYLISCKSQTSLIAHVKITIP